MEQSEDRIYSAVARALADFFSAKESPPVPVPVTVKEVGAKRSRRYPATEYILRSMRKARKYTKDARYPAKIALRGWMAHGKLLKLSREPADVFNAAMASLIGDGTLREVTAEELAQIGFITRQKVYAFKKNTELTPDLSPGDTKNSGACSGVLPTAPEQVEVL